MPAYVAQRFGASKQLCHPDPPAGTWTAALRGLLDSRASPILPRAVQNPQPTAEPPEPAGLGRRLVALAYDSLLLAALLFFFTLAVFLARGAREVPAGTHWFQASLVGVAALFYCGFWTHGGQTLGMRAWRIRLIREDGGAVGWGSALLRFLAAWASALPLGLGYWWILVDRRRRTWHDALSHTAVVREPSSGRG